MKRIEHRESGTDAYQLTDHLGNVRAVIMKNGGNAVSLTAKTDYYPGGMAMPNRNIVGNYRYKFQGQEKDPETGMEAFELRLYDSRINRWLKPDPYRQFPTPYSAMGNNPISAIDKDGGYVYILGKNGELKRLYNWVSNTDIGIKSIGKFIDDPDNHVFIAQADLQSAGAGGATWLINKKSKSTFTLADAKRQGGYENGFKDYYHRFIGITLQPGDNYLVALDIQRFNSKSHYMLEAAWHELFQHIVLNEEGITNGTQQHLTAGGSVSGLNSRRPNVVGFSSAIDGPPALSPFPVEIFKQQIEQLKQPNGTYNFQDMLQFQRGLERLMFTPKGKEKCGCN